MIPGGGCTWREIQGDEVSLWPVAGGGAGLRCTSDMGTHCTHSTYGTSCAAALITVHQVATKRVKHAIKSDIPSVGDHISKLLHIGKATVDKLMDLRAAFQEEGERRGGGGRAGGWHEAGCGSTVRLLRCSWLEARVLES